MEKWKSIQFCVFDTPEQPQMSYEKRQRVIQYCTVPNPSLKYVFLNQLNHFSEVVPMDESNIKTG